MQRIKLKSCLIVGAWFGIFQGLMPLIGYLLGSTFADKITSVSHWIAFILLAIIGANMIKEAFEKEEECTDCSLGFKAMLIMAIATSIDALATGLTFAATGANIWIAISLIGIVTFACCFVGSIVGAKIGSKCQTQAEIAGGIILIAIGVKFLIEHFLG
jgi:putative Mn2+ efflux pump MntP